MKLIFIGGTGLISSACVALAVRQGHEVWVLNRGRSHALPLPPEVRTLVADAGDPGAMAGAVAGHRFDAVLQFVAYTPDQVKRDIEAFAGCGQYVFISSASAYQKPPGHYLVTESGTPLDNPFWRYSRDKIECERELLAAYAQRNFPVTIVRPSFTYGPSQIPVAVGSWERPFTIVDRMRRGAAILVPGDGTSLWTLTHNTDFAAGLLGLLGNPAAIGEDVHITSDEVLTWNDIYAQLAAAAGTTATLLHVPTDALIAADPSYLGSLWGDKAHSVVFDNSKIRRLVPGFAARVPFAQGIGETVAWFDAVPARQAIDADANARWDRIGAIYTEALDQVAAAS